ncbi:hypothetical protein ACFQE1_10550 [Halobium palmae]|uniref:Uncharacterized protein n=1 Tax=Halobium palmae TaxID=1776492 RepID=A0ABD5RZW6_9EURY
MIALGQREVAHPAEDDDEREGREGGDPLEVPDDGEPGGQVAEDEAGSLGEGLLFVLVGRVGVELIR